MTSPSPATIEREREKLYVTDAELIRRLGVPEKMARALLHDLDTKHPAFPKRQKIWGGRRYWPAVKHYFDRLNGILPGDAARATARTPVPHRPPRHSPSAAPTRRAYDELSPKD